MSYEDLTEGTVVINTDSGNSLTVANKIDSGTIVWDDGISETPNSIKQSFESGKYKLANN